MVKESRFKVIEKSALKYEPSIRRTASKLCSTLRTKVQYGTRCLKGATLRSQPPVKCWWEGTRGGEQEALGWISIFLVYSSISADRLLRVNLFSQKGGYFFFLLPKVTLLQVFSILKESSTCNIHPTHIHKHPNEQNLILLEEKKNIWSIWKLSQIWQQACGIYPNCLEWDRNLQILTFHPYRSKAMYEPRVIKSFKALGVKNNSIKAASHSQHSQRVEKLALFSKYRTRPENCTNTSELVFCSNLLPVGNWQGIPPTYNLILQLSLTVGHRGDFSSELAWNQALSKDDTS